MELFHESIFCWKDWGRVYQSLESFRELIGYIYKKEGIECGTLSHCTPGTNAVFRAGDTIIKIFAPVESGFNMESDYRTERFGIMRANALGIPSPTLLASGEVNDKYRFDYIIMDYIDGRELGEHRNGIGDAEKMRIGRELRKITDRLNRPCEAPNAVDAKKRAYKAVRWKGFSDRFNRERCRYLDRIPEEEMVYVHGDLTLDNILVDRDGRFVVIDFADSLLAPACYELPVLLLEVFEFGRPYLLGYFGSEMERDSAEEEIAEQCLTGLLLHDYGGDLIRSHIGDPTEIEGIGDLKKRLMCLCKSGR